jgi:hypothetical protein
MQVAVFHVSDGAHQVARDALEQAQRRRRRIWPNYQNFRVDAFDWHFVSLSCTPPIHD